MKYLVLTIAGFAAYCAVNFSRGDLSIGGEALFLALPVVAILFDIAKETR